MPLRDHALPTPTVDSASVIAKLDSPDFQIPYLGNSTGVWLASIALDNDGARDTFAASMVDSAARLELALTFEQLAAIEVVQDGNRLVDALSDQVADRYGDRADARFAVEFHTQVAARLLRDGPNVVGGGELPVLRHQAGIHMLDALSAATHLDVNTKLIEEAQGIALPLLARTDVASAPEAIEAWADSVDNAFRNVPTPMPPPAEAEQIGTDITVELLPGNRFRGEIRHEQLGCSACHIAAAVAPQWQTFDGVENPSLLEIAETRWQDPGYTGTATSATEYLIESTVLPDIDVVDGYEIALMSVDYAEQISKQDMADILAFLMAIGQ